MKNKKIIIITTLVIISFIIIGLVYAVVTENLQLFSKTTTGSVKIENFNLSFNKQNGEKVDVLEPADIANISWTTKNIGTAGILTRHTLEIFWEEDVDVNASELLKLYPANISNEQILEDFEKGETSEYTLRTEKATKTVDGVTRYGIKYVFTGDILDGTDMTGISKEQNYNNSDIDETTDDNENNLDNIAFKVLLSPRTSYLYQGKKVSISITTEAVQYTKQGESEWVVVDTQEF